ncbi:adenosylcobinamide-GDP ribazoletransferase [archaeon]|nr:adenosylcobinamide-GDP ribazoletransferase [archaeon]
MIKALRNAFGFLTIIPVGMDFDTEDVAKSAWLFPLVGGFLGLTAALIYELLGHLFSDPVSAGIALFALLVLTGFHHLDGLLDFGDGLMRVGSAKERRSAMKDVNTGVGGFAFGFFVLLITYAAITENTTIFISLIAAEASAKFAMVLGAFVGKPSHEGMGSIFTKIVDTRLLLLALIVYIPFLAILPIEMGLLAFAMAVASTLIITFISLKLFKGVPGDVLGAINEITRMGVLVVLLV